MNLPTGTVTFVNIDIDSSVVITNKLKVDLYEHDLRNPLYRYISDALEGHGVLFQTAGDGFLSVFQQSASALAFAKLIQTGLNDHPLIVPESKDHQESLTVKIAIHTTMIEGEPKSKPDSAAPPSIENCEYPGGDTNFVSRLLSSARAGQTLVSSWTYNRSERVRDQYKWQKWPDCKIKDFIKPQTVWELVIGESKGRPRAANADWYEDLRPTPYVPRKDLEEAIEAWLSDPNGSGLLTLHASGGMGKSELARKSGSQAYAQFQEVCYIELDRHFDHPADLASLMGERLGLSGNDSTPGKMVQYLRVDLRGQRVLFILDHYDLVAENSEIKTFLRSLVHEARNVRILLTGRSKTKFDEEAILPVGEMTPAEAEELFLDIAHRKGERDWKPTKDEKRDLDKLLGEICLYIPMIIKIAAGQMANNTVFGIYETLKRTPFPALDSWDEKLSSEDQKRHLSIKRSISWSWDLLDTGLQKSFVGLGLFKGGCTDESFLQVCGGPKRTEDLNHLLHASLVTLDRRNRRRRFSLNGYIYTFAQEKLGELPLDELNSIEDRFIHYFLSLIDAAVPSIDHSDVNNTVKELEMEVRNVTHSLVLLARRDPPHAARVITSLWRFWWTRGHARDGLELLESVLPDCKSDLAIYSEATKVAGHLARHLGNLDKRYEAKSNRAKNLFAESLAAAKALYEKEPLRSAALQSAVQRQIGVFEWHSNEQKRAHQAFKEALIQARASQSPLESAECHYELGNNIYRTVDHIRAEKEIRKSLEFYLKSDDPHKTGTAYLALGNIRYDLNDREQASDYYAKALPLFLRTGFKSRLAMLLERIARLASANPSDAARLLGAADQIRSDIHSPLPSRDRTEYYEKLEISFQKQLGGSTFENFFEQGTSMEDDKVIAIARKLVNSLHPD